MVTIFGIIFFVGVIGNIFVITVVRKKLTGFQIATNNLILSLSTADLIFLVLNPPIATATFLNNEWKLGNLVCKLAHFGINVSMLASIYTLVALSFDRYSSLGEPFKLVRFPPKTHRNSKITVFVVWCISIIISFPYLLVFTTVEMEHGLVCFDKWKDPLRQKPRYFLTMFVLGYSIPLILISATYIVIWRTAWSTLNHTTQKNSGVKRSRRNVTIIISIVILSFGICWFPHNLFYVWLSIAKENFPYTYGTYILKLVALSCSYLNSSINPIIYSLMSKKFREAAKIVWQDCFTKPQGRRPYSSTPVPKIYRGVRTRNTPRQNSNPKQWVELVPS
ncbi:Galanin receptor type 2 [Holothuria leucospilota]|uniref:Galanin receptor type 2 n=1 Tax=Holothuria leucospilota TaxID=206669 RepID=A0A9Q1C2V9_HOLLE|nr:Galanin receptor type 2 [Holothuria leucospilota]